MKKINLIKGIPFLLTLSILILIKFSNQKQYTNLKLIIWDTPSLSLGSYIAISTGSGFILSYIFTTSLAKSNNYKTKQKIKYKQEVIEDDNNLYEKLDNERSYEKNLIERDLKEPSPTINATFRVITNKNIKEKSSKNDYEIYENDSTQFDQELKQDLNYKNDNEFNQILNDWEDDTYLNW
tara:strand:- start:9182 stop:9724 length:543 start_codon:yes stop_codon:yes gene_type:complete